MRRSNNRSAPPSASSALARFFTQTAPLDPGSRLLVAFSGGPDSTALLAAATRWSARAETEILAAHFDHGLDEGAAWRARQAAAIAAKLGVPCTIGSRDPTDPGRPREGGEAAARRARYAFLEQERLRVGAEYVATAHHLDDQAETVLVRMLLGTGLDGLAGIAAVWGAVARPLLEVPRATLLEELDDLELEPVDDPTNLEMGVPRNLIRHALLPGLISEDAGVSQRLCDLAKAARRARSEVRSRLEAHLNAQAASDGATCDLGTLTKLPTTLLTPALALLHRLAGADYPPPIAARKDLSLQLSRGRRIGCDCGRGWRWESDGEVLRLSRQPRETPSFAYTLRVPGEIEIPELSILFRLEQGEIASWMTRGSPRRAGLALDLAEGDLVEVRNRRPGDRIRPFGCSYERRLKDVLIDRRVPQHRRDELPLLLVGGSVAWVPGVTIDDRFRIGDSEPVWIAEFSDS